MACVQIYKGVRLLSQHIIMEVCYTIVGAQSHGWKVH